MGDSDATAAVIEKGIGQGNKCASALLDISKNFIKSLQNGTMDNLINSISGIEIKTENIERSLDYVTNGINDLIVLGNTTQNVIKYDASLESTYNIVTHLKDNLEKNTDLLSENTNLIKNLIDTANSTIIEGNIVFENIYQLLEASIENDDKISKSVQDVTNSVISLVDSNDENTQLITDSATNMSMYLNAFLNTFSGYIDSLNYLLKDENKPRFMKLVDPLSFPKENCTNFLYNTSDILTSQMFSTENEKILTKIDNLSNNCEFVFKSLTNTTISEAINDTNFNYLDEIYSNVHNPENFFEIATFTMVLFMLFLQFITLCKSFKKPKAFMD